MNQQKGFMIAGHTVVFPYQPYPNQFAMMEKVIRAISRKENALLESATGTGKSLALLCGSLAWQTAEKDRLRKEKAAEHSGQYTQNNQNNRDFNTTTTSTTTSTTFTTSTNSTTSIPSATNFEQHLQETHHSSNSHTSHNSHTSQNLDSQLSEMSQNSRLSQDSNLSQNLNFSQNSNISQDYHFSQHSQYSQQMHANQNQQSQFSHQLSQESQPTQQSQFSNNSQTQQTQSQSNSQISSDSHPLSHSSSSLQHTQLSQIESSQPEELSEESQALLREFDMFQEMFDKSDDVNTSQHSITSTSNTPRRAKQFIEEETISHLSSSDTPIEFETDFTPTSSSYSTTTTTTTNVIIADIQTTETTKMSKINETRETREAVTETSTVTANTTHTPSTIIDIDIEPPPQQTTINKNKSKPKPIPAKETSQKNTRKHIKVEITSDDELPAQKPKQTKNKPEPPSKTGISKNSNNDDGDDDFLPTPIFKTPKRGKEKEKKASRAKKKTKTTPPPLPPPSPISPASPSVSLSTSPPPSKYVKAPTIFFGTRTHSQVAQLVAELGRTGYRPKMSVLAARDHYCLHPTVSRMPNKTTECKRMVALESCKFDKGTRRLSKSESLIGKIWDIEDLVKLGSQVTGCPYYAARGIAKAADIVFCPYNYILDPGIRETMGINIEGAALIFDEAHNIEDVLMSVASGDFELEDLTNELLKQLTHFCKIPTLQDAYSPIQKVVSGIVEWMLEGIQGLTPTDFETHTNFWSGDDLVDVLARSGVSLENFGVFVESVVAVEELSSENSSTKVGLTYKALSILLDLSKVLRLLFSEGLRFSGDFRVVIQKASRHEKGRSFWTHSLGIWCLSPRVAYRGLMPARSIILTSGTLSPMDSYASELGTKFDWPLELGHVINTNRQLYACVVAQGPNGQKINTTFQNADSYGVQDAIGESLAMVLGCIPGGALCFFPSYSLLERLITRWQTTGMWAKLQSVKEVLSEPRGSGSDFSQVLASYYKAAASPRGAVLLAVCRGKASEGLDFTDHFARAVIVVGIPYPNVKELRILLKRNYNDQHSNENGLMDGRSWYQLQAFRALNQALGRCIRHKNDYGSIILIDDRFLDANVISKLSKWVRGNVRKDNIQQTAATLTSFFASHQHAADMKKINTFV